jgi:hypothetical protein
MVQKTPLKGLKIGPWPGGIDNRLPNHSVSKNHLRNAVNVDIDNTGRLRSRKGYTKIYSSSGSHSLYSCPLGTFFVDGTALKVLNTDNTSVTIFNGISGTVCYCYINGEVYFSDRAKARKINSGLTVVPWGVDTDTTISVNSGNYSLDVDIYNPVPVADIIRFYRGRIYVVAGSVVWYTDPYAYDIFKYASNYLQFPNTITVFEAVTNGIWCVSDKTYFLGGTEPKEFIVQTQLNYGAIANTSLEVPNTNDVMWMSQRGLCMGDQDGQVVNLQEQHVAVNPGTTGAAIIREHDGLKQYVATYAPSGTTKIASTDWMEFEVIRKA